MRYIKKLASGTWWDQPFYGSTAKIYVTVKLFYINQKASMFTADISSENNPMYVNYALIRAHQ